VSPVFAHGQLRLYVLALLNDGPRHGYEVIQDLEQRFNGMYTPSAGTVYPRLAKLEEEGLVERTDEGRKAVYRITDAGRAEVRERAADLDNLESELQQSARDIAEGVRERVRSGAPGLRAELKDAAREARETARPIGVAPGHERFEAGAIGDLERAFAEVRLEAREALRRHGLTADQTREVVAVLSEARERIRALLRPR
jgi:DNA-binding PadR family transcriptional regulator